MDGVAGRSTWRDCGGAVDEVKHDDQMTYLSTSGLRDLWCGQHLCFSYPYGQALQNNPRHNILKIPQATLQLFDTFPFVRAKEMCVLTEKKTLLFALYEPLLLAD